MDLSGQDLPSLTANLSTNWIRLASSQVGRPIRLRKHVLVAASAPATLCVEPDSAGCRHRLLCQSRGHPFDKLVCVEPPHRRRSHCKD